MPAVLIRAMRPDDVDAVCAVDRLCFACPWSRETFAAEASNAIGWYRLAECAGGVVGYIGSHVILDEAHITTLGVHPEFRRRRIAERLLADVLRHAVGAGARRITLEVRETNAGAVALYRKYGFAPVSRRPRYYSDSDEDALVMWIEDTSRIGFRTLFEERLAVLRQAKE